MNKEVTFYRALIKASLTAKEDATNPRVKSTAFTPLVDAAVANALAQVAKAYREAFLE